MFFSENVETLNKAKRDIGRGLREHVKPVIIDAVICTLTGTCPDIIEKIKDVIKDDSTQP